MPYRSRRPRYRRAYSSSVVNEPQREAETISKDGMLPTVVVHFADVKDMLLRKIRDNKTTGQPGLDRYLSPAVRDPLTPNGLGGVHDFAYEHDGQKIRPTTQDAIKWMEYGFVSDAMMNSAQPVPMGFQTRPAWSEDEGDIDVGRLAAGYDDFYLGQTQQQSKPGLHVQFDCWFSAGVPNPVIAEYGRCLMDLISGMESMGFDMTIDAYSVTNETFEGDSGGRAIAIRVKNQKETNDMMSYSCLFSPIGTRLVVFTAMGTGAKKVGKQVGSWFGMARGGDWSLKYDPDTGVVRITGAQMAVWSEKGSSFPRKEIIQAAVDAGLIPPQD